MIVTKLFIIPIQRELKIWGGCHHLLLVYDASKLSTVYVAKSPVLDLQWAPENLELAPSVLVLSDLLFCLILEAE